MLKSTTAWVCSMRSKVNRIALCNICKLHFRYALTIPRHSIISVSYSSASRNMRRPRHNSKKEFGWRRLSTSPISTLPGSTRLKTMLRRPARSCSICSAFSLTTLRQNNLWGCYDRHFLYTFRESMEAIIRHFCSMKISAHLIPSRMRSGALATMFVCMACLYAQPPRNTSTDFKEAQRFVEQHEFYEARTSVTKALQRNPKSVEGYNLLGIIDSNLKDYAGALTAFRKALELAPNSVKTHNNLGGFYLTVRQVNDAEKEFRTVLRLAPADSEGNYNLGVLLMAKGAPTEAIPHFERVHPQNTATELNLVRAYFAARRPGEAMRLATRLSSQSNEVQVHFSLGVLLASERQYKAAQDELAKADAQQPNTFEIVYNLGLAF